MCVTGSEKKKREQPSLCGGCVSICNMAWLLYIYIFFLCGGGVAYCSTYWHQRRIKNKTRSNSDRLKLIETKTKSGKSFVLNAEQMIESLSFLFFTIWRVKKVRSRRLFMLERRGEKELRAAFVYIRLLEKFSFVSGLSNRYEWL